MMPDQHQGLGRGPIRTRQRILDPDPLLMFALESALIRMPSHNLGRNPGQDPNPRGQHLLNLTTPIRK
ncbi:unnamed protein product [Dibothriocephalus latus]|uniref:Uncharacterized protein n=1 Tax=Dibothriocephalus latus TaxID=60516 RepID=A0A3P7LVR1_DIBLA|nr:unnamed protein product [Dibothriocephalus latus]